MIETFHGNSLCTVCIFLGDSWPYLLERLVLPHPVTSLAAQVSMLFNIGVWMPRGDISGCHLPQESLSDRIAKFFCSPYERYYNLIYSALFHYHPNVLHQYLCCILRSTTTINQYHLLPKSVVGVLNINSWASSTILEPASLRNQTLGQHRRTWLRISHSGYNTPEEDAGVSFWGLDTVYQPTPLI
jgi:hypothetical protein